MFDYDGWLESPYTTEDAGMCDTKDCPVCYDSCEQCDSTGKIPIATDSDVIQVSIQCETCEGEGVVESGDYSKQAHRDYYESD